MRSKFEDRLIRNACVLFSITQSFHQPTSLHDISARITQNGKPLTSDFLPRCRTSIVDMQSYRLEPTYLATRIVQPEGICHGSPASRVCEILWKHQNSICSHQSSLVVTIPGLQDFALPRPTFLGYTCLI